MNSKWELPRPTPTACPGRQYDRHRASSAAARRLFVPPPNTYMTRWPSNGQRRTGSKPARHATRAATLLDRQPATANVSGRRVATAAGRHAGHRKCQQQGRKGSGRATDYRVHATIIRRSAGQVNAVLLRPDSGIRRIPAWVGARTAWLARRDDMHYNVGLHQRQEIWSWRGQCTARLSRSASRGTPSPMSRSLACKTCRPMSG